VKLLIDEDTASAALLALALERTPHHGVIGIFRPGSSQWLSYQQIVAALDRLAQLE